MIVRTCVRKQPIIALYFEFENELKFYNLEAWLPGLFIQFYCIVLSEWKDPSLLKRETFSVWVLFILIFTLLLYPTPFFYIIIIALSFNRNYTSL